VTAAIARGVDHENISQEELIVMARMSLRKGEINTDEMQVIQNILSLEDKTVQAVMTPRSVVFVLGAQVTVKQAQVREEILTHSRIPVFFENTEDIEGVVHRRDILNAVAKSDNEIKLEQLMKPVHFVLEKDRLDKVLKLFLDRAEHLFIVIDEFGGLAGVITLEDVLEEILGREIVDEFDEVTDMRELAQTRRQKVIQDAQNLPPIRRNRLK
jgi:CBS domain containing-hemolysin-like protein